jgi:uncharacterized protein
MKKNEIIDKISRGRTDLVFDLLALPDWKNILNEGEIKVLQWFVYYNDVTALKAILANGGDLSSIDLNGELRNAAFFGHWKVVDFLIKHGADVNFAQPDTGETALHSSLAKAGRPYYLFVVKLLIENGANINAKTISGKETGVFMRDVRTKGETPLHRAAAYADEEIIKYLLENGADKEAQDAYGNSPISYASEHLRPGKILYLLQFGNHFISEKYIRLNTSDHGEGWGKSMEQKFIGEFLPESLNDANE